MLLEGIQKLMVDDEITDVRERMSFKIQDDKFYIFYEASDQDAVKSLKTQITSKLTEIDKLDFQTESIPPNIAEIAYRNKIIFSL